MEHWAEDEEETGDKTLELLREVGVVSISWIASTGEFEIREECDSWFSAKYTKSELLAALEEALNWVRQQPEQTLM